MEESWQYAPRVVLPRRIKADLVDGAIAAVIFIVPVLVGQAVSDVVPDTGLRQARRSTGAMRKSLASWRWSRCHPWRLHG
jgi:hypothetical protein